MVQAGTPVANDGHAGPDLLSSASYLIAERVERSVHPTIVDRDRTRTPAGEALNYRALQGNL